MSRLTETQSQRHEERDGRALVQGVEESRQVRGHRGRGGLRVAAQPVLSFVRRRGVHRGQGLVAVVPVRAAGDGSRVDVGHQVALALEQPTVVFGRHAAERPLGHQLVGQGVQNLFHGGEAFGPGLGHAGPVVAGRRGRTVAQAVAEQGPGREEGGGVGADIHA